MGIVVLVDAPGECCHRHRSSPCTNQSIKSRQRREAELLEEGVVLGSRSPNGFLDADEIAMRESVQSPRILALI